MHHDRQQLNAFGAKQAPPSRHCTAHWISCTSKLGPENRFEAFPLFAAAVVSAHLTVIPGATITMWSVAFVVLRVLYVGLYLFDKSSLRTLIWV